jgi:peptidoglycan/LPS O-acetylase OafA/YrhL
MIEDAPQKQVYIPGLDGIRAIAFLLVYFAHSGLGIFIPGGLGVTIFFFLSGYLITTLLRMESSRTGTISIGQFYLRRTFRIFPPMYVTLVVWMLLTSMGVFVGRVEWQPILLASLYMTNYTDLFTLHRIQGGLNILWSLSVEEHFYLVFPWVFLLFMKRKWSAPHRAMLLGGLCVAALVWRYFLMTHFQAISNYEHTDTRFDSILFGCLFAIVLNPFLDEMPEWINKHASVLAFTGLGLLLLCLLLRSAFFRDTGRYTLQGIGLGGIFVYLLNTPKGWVVRCLEHPFLRLLGRRSYAMYLIHYCVLQSIEKKLGLGMVTVLILGAAPVYGYAWAMSHFVEEPMQKIKKRFSPQPAFDPVRSQGRILELQPAE